jgi:hypothetical protein
MNERNESDWITGMDAACRYGVSVYTVMAWRKFRDFPEDAVCRFGSVNYWHVPTIDRWLAFRPKSKHGPIPRWRGVVEARAAQYNSV